MAQNPATAEVAPKPLSILDKAKMELGSKTIVAFLGKTSYGKTVVSTLLYDALVNFFLKKHRDEYNARILKGQDSIYQLHTQIFSGKFPPPTPPGQETETIIEINRKPPLGKKIELIMHDISGEDVGNLLLSPYSEPKELVNYILNYPTSSDSYGPFSYLIFAKLYVILIDCSEYGLWKSEQIRISQMLSAILALKEGIGEVTDGKAQPHIAIVLTKADTLNDPEQNAEELIKENMSEVYSNLSEHFVGKISYYKVCIESTKRSEDEINAAINEDLTTQSKKTLRENYLKQTKIDTEVKIAAAEAKKTALTSGQTPEQAEAVATAAGETKKLSLMRQTYEQEGTAEIDLALKRRYYQYKMKMPPNYSSDDYMNLILWMITSLS